ncbi:MAG: hypothetical protein U0703_01020 [Anaerolineae bacterium]
MFRESVLTVGTSLGIERIIDLMDILNSALRNGGTVVQVMVSVFGDDGRHGAGSGVMGVAGVNTELYLQDKNIGKQMSYADRKGILPGAAM